MLTNPLKFWWSLQKIRATTAIDELLVLKPASLFQEVLSDVHLFPTSARHSAMGDKYLAIAPPLFSARQQCLDPTHIHIHKAIAESSSSAGRKEEALPWKLSTHHPQPPFPADEIFNAKLFLSIFIKTTGHTGPASGVWVSFGGRGACLPFWDSSPKRQLWKLRFFFLLLLLHLNIHLLQEKMYIDL